MKKNKLTGLVGTVALHAVLLLLLFLVAIHKPMAQEEGGVPVMLGDVPQSQGNADPYTLTDVDIWEEPELPAEVAEPIPVPEVETKAELITQADEPTIAVPEKKEQPKPKEVKTKKEPVKAKEQPAKPKEKTEAEKRAEAERLAAEKKKAEEKAAAEAAAKRVSGAFGKGSQIGSKGTGTTGEGIQGSPTGNAAEGKPTGVGGESSWDLKGRSLGAALPMPEYKVQEEGVVVVSIVVTPAGIVDKVSINIKGTKTANEELRRAALEAAKKARFNSVNMVDNQTGTITYNFKLK